RVLHGVVGLADRAEHSVAHRPQLRTVGVEQARPRVRRRVERGCHAAWPAGVRSVTLTRLKKFVMPIHNTIDASCSLVKCSAAFFQTSSGTESLESARRVAYSASSSAARLASSKYGTSRHAATAKSFSSATPCWRALRQPMSTQ